MQPAEYKPLDKDNIWPSKSGYSATNEILQDLHGHLKTKEMDQEPRADKLIHLVIEKEHAEEREQLINDENKKNEENKENIDPNTRTCFDRSAIDLLISEKMKRKREIEDDEAVTNPKKSKLEKRN